MYNILYIFFYIYIYIKLFMGLLKYFLKLIRFNNIIKVKFSLFFYKNIIIFFKLSLFILFSNGILLVVSLRFTW